MCFVCPCRVEVVACLIHSLSRSSFQKYIFTLKHCPIQSGSSLILPNQNLIFLKFQISRKQLNINKWYFFFIFWWIKRSLRQKETLWQSTTHLVIIKTCYYCYQSIKWFWGFWTGLCSTGPQVPRATNFCLWVIKKTWFFHISLSVEHPGFCG